MLAQSPPAAALDVLLYEWMYSYYDKNTFTDKAREAERRRRVALGQFVMQCDRPGGSKQFRVFANVDAAYNFIIAQPQHERTFYETIFDVHPARKPYFDLDIIPTETDPLSHSELLSLLLTEIKRVIGPDLDLVDDIGVYSSHAADGSKFSYHVVVCGYHVHSNEDAKNFAKTIRDGMIAATPGPQAQYIMKVMDLSVYKNLQQFRILSCSKLGRNRFKNTVFEYSASGRQRQRPAIQDPKLEFCRSLLSLVDLTTSKYLEPVVYTRQQPKLSDDEARIHAVFQMARRLRDGGHFDPETLWLKDSKDIVSHVIDAGHLTVDLAGNCERHTASTSEQGALIALRAPPQRGYYCCICDRLHEHENPYITLHQDSNSNASTDICPRVVEIRFHCRRDPTTTMRLCSIRGGGDSGMASFTCQEQPFDTRQGERFTRTIAEASSAID